MARAELVRAGGFALSLVKDQRGGTLVGVREPVDAVVVSARKLNFFLTT
jgi:hypothetical protein